MPHHFSTVLTFDGKNVPASIIAQMRSDGLYYEVNAKGYPRFFMRYTELGRYDALPEEGITLPYALVLAASDMIEKADDRKRR